MPLELAPLTHDADFPPTTPWMFAAMRPNGFIDACWPRNEDPQAQQIHATGFIVHRHGDPTVSWIKVTDTDTSTIIGMAQWFVLRGEKPAEMEFDGVPGAFRDEAEKKYAQAVFRSFARFRREMVVEATPAARWLYEKWGFVTKEHFKIEGEGFGRSVVQRLFFMVRPRAGE